MQARSPVSFNTQLATGFGDGLSQKMEYFRPIIIILYGSIADDVGMGWWAVSYLLWHSMSREEMTAHIQP